MIEAAMIWNEPNNKSHWDPEIDPEWVLFAEMAKAAGQAIKAANPRLPRVLAAFLRSTPPS
jgi:beta-xylosidase